MGFACFCTEPGRGFESEKRENGNGIGVLLAYQWDRDTGQWDLEKIGGWEMGLVAPLQDPLLRLSNLRDAFLPPTFYMEFSEQGVEQGTKSEFFRDHQLRKFSRQNKI